VKLREATAASSDPGLMTAARAKTSAVGEHGFQPAKWVAETVWKRKTHPDDLGRLELQLKSRETGSVSADEGT